jgi:hypothetical protein
MAKQYRLEDDLIKKTIPKFKSSRYKRLQNICLEKGLWPSVDCEICGTYLINPQSILIHQGGSCRKKLKYE